MRRTSKPPAVPALDAGLRLLARRAHSRSEMRSKLGRRGYEESDVDAALARLIELGYLDDRAFAAGHVRRRSAGRGALALSAELAARGVGRAIAAQAVAGLGEEAQLGAARALARRLAGSRTYAGYKELLERVGPKLIRRGFPLAIVRAACAAVSDGTANTPDN